MVLQKWDLPQKCASTPKVNMEPPTLASGAAPLVFPSRSGLGVSKVSLFFNRFMALFLERFLLVSVPSCSSSSPLTLGLDEGVFPGSLGLWDQGMIPVINT